MKNSQKSNQEAVSLRVYGDFGGSGSKFLYQVKPPQSQWKKLSGFLMPSEIASGSRETFEKKIPENSLIEDKCWVEVMGKDFAVGYLAQLFDGVATLKQSKFIKAVLKTVAGISVIAAKEQILSSSIKVKLTSFLPYGEKANKDYYISVLNALCKEEVKTVYGKLKIELDDIIICSEGEGIYDVLPQPEKIAKKIGIMMMGYRNLSVIIGERGAIRKGHTTELGMVKLSEQVGKAEGICDYGKLTQFLVKAKVNEEKAINQLLSKEGNLKKSERKDNLKKEIARAREGFLSQAIDWFKEIIEEDVDMVVLCGGTSEYLGKSLEEKLSKEFPWLEIKWHSDLSIPEGLVELSVDQYKRCADVYGEWLYQTQNSEQ